MSISSDYMFG